MINQHTIEPSTSCPDNRYPLLSTFNRMPFNPHQPDQVLVCDYLEFGQDLSVTYGDEVKELLKNTAGDYIAFARAVETYTSKTIDVMGLNRSALHKAVLARNVLANVMYFDMSDVILGYLARGINQRSDSEAIRELVKIVGTEEYRFIGRLVYTIKSCIDQNWDETDNSDLSKANRYGQSIFTQMEYADPDADDLLRRFIIEHTLENALRSNVEPILEPEGGNYSLTPDTSYDGRFDLQEN